MRRNPLSPLLLVAVSSAFCAVKDVQGKDIVFILSWNADEKKCVPCHFDEQKQHIFTSFTEHLEIRGEAKHTYQLSSVVYEDIALPSYYTAEALPKEPQFKVDFGKSRSQHYLSVVYFPLIHTGGKVRLVKKVVFEVNSTPVYRLENRSATFASSSVLASGSWYKIGVRKSGVYKISRNFLQTIGVTTASLQPNHINIYGNHIPQLPLSNQAYHPDDLIKNAIYVSGDSDGTFDASDYILFYATGPEIVNYGAASVNVRKNPIDSMNYYFIHIDAADPPKRVGILPNATAAATHTTTTFNDAVLHEKNDRNLIQSGNHWLEEPFDLTPVKNISIQLKGLDVSSPVSLKTKYASSVPNGSASLVVRINGVERDEVAAPNGLGTYQRARFATSSVDFISNSPTLNTTLSWSSSSPSSSAWLDYLLLNYRRRASLSSGQILIRDLATVASGHVVNYSVSEASPSSFFWEVTDPTNAAALQGNLTGNVYSFTHTADSLRSYVAFNIDQTYTPTFVGAVANQNLHAIPQLDYLIVAYRPLMPQAERLADLHRNRGLKVSVVDIQQVYNEFSGGVADPVAVRWIMKMFYDRSGGEQASMPRYLCLFGDGSYDPLNRIDRNNYLVPTYNNDDNDDNIDYIDSYTSDDFFGILDDDEAMSPSDMMDIGVGRIPVNNLTTAQQVVDKIQHYMNFGSSLYTDAEGVQHDESGYASSFGDWRTRLVLMADDEDGGQFVRDCEEMSKSTEERYPEMNIVKIYLDGYNQVITSGGQRYPEVEEAINQNMNKGALVFNYVGHGGETGLTLERAVTIPMIEKWANVNNMTIFISATCEFSRFDDPERTSAGEITLTTPLGGAVALLTTTRLVFISLNSELVRHLYSVLFKEEEGVPLALGEIIRRTKNLTSSTENKRNFALLGDPAMHMGKPQPRILTDSINGVSVKMANDTLKALSKITVSGHVADKTGSVLSSYNGIVYPTIYDKEKVRYTLAQDAQSPKLPYTIQTNVIYKGKATVSNGRFSFSFVVPKDIDYTLGKGRISYYSNDATSNRYGYDTTIVVGGIDPKGVEDDEGPTVVPYMNDPNFVDGGMTDESPLFIAEIADENGINTTGNGIGHDIVLIVDGNTADPIVLNSFYEADLDTYQSGKVTYPFTQLEPGNHQLLFKVWDVNNNSSETAVNFTVVASEEPAIARLINYPNPFTTHTDFYVEHNQVSRDLSVRIEVFTVSGKLVKTILDQINSVAFRSKPIPWDGKDDYGDPLARGVYIYRLQIETPDGKKAEKLEKLVLL